MARLSTKAYIREARAFFVDFHKLLDDRIQAIEKGAQGVSANVSQWIAILADDNVISVLAKLDKYDDKISNHSMWPPVFESLLGWIGWRAPNSASIQRDHARPVVVAKTTEQLLRAKETLVLMNRNSQYGAQFIPVPPHIKLADQTKKVLEDCERLIDKYAAYSQQAQPREHKSWWTDAMRKALDFVALRVSAHGLGNKDNQSPALKALNDIREGSRQYQQRKLRPSKATRQALKCSHDFELPGKDSLFYQYVPRGLSRQIATCDQLLLSQTNNNNITKEAVLDLLKADFPKPNRSYRRK